MVLQREGKFDYREKSIFAGERKMNKKRLITKTNPAEGNSDRPGATGSGADAKTGKRRITFKFDSIPGRSVSVAGSFNDWDPEAKVLVDKNGTGVYTGVILLPPGIISALSVKERPMPTDSGRPVAADISLRTPTVFETPLGTARYRSCGECVRIQPAAYTSAK